MEVHINITDERTDRQVSLINAPTTHPGLLGN